MLKLNQQGQTTAITFSKRERFLSRPFLLALVIALGLHAAGALVFYIQPFRVSQDYHLFPPALVDFDLFFSDMLVTSEIEDTKRKKLLLLMPQGSVPEITKEISVHTHTANEPMLTLNQHINPFLKIEREPQTPQDLARKTYLPLSIICSGPLSSLTPSIDLPKPIQAQKETISYRVSYDVLVQNESGEIFWFDKLNQTGNILMRTKAESLFSKLRFSKSQLPGVTRGLVEITVTNEGES